MILIFFVLTLFTRGILSTVLQTCEGNTANILCPSSTLININSANYGRHDSTICPNKGVDSNTQCSSENAIEIVKQNCQNKENCSISATNAVFTDPCVGTYKYLEINYTCESPVPAKAECKENEEGYCVPICILGYCSNQCFCFCKKGFRKDNNKNCVPEEPKTDETYVCEGRTVNITCLSSEEIQIDYANYGRRSTKICPKLGLDLNTKCISTKTIDILRKQCDGQQYCFISASNTVFSDPCFGTYKYLELNYTCQPKCGENEERGCTNTCTLDACPAVCTPGCVCKAGYERDISGKCVPQRESNVISACEGNELNIDCSAMEVIQINSANYGRQSSEICPSDGLDKNTNCVSPDAANIVREICDGLQNCTVDANNAVFGDPCVGTYKYLQINYTCYSRFGPGPDSCVGRNEEWGCDNPCFRHCNAPDVCTSDCRKFGCICQKGFKRDNITGECVAEDHCPLPGDECETHEEYTECGAGCEPTCEIRKPIYCTTECIPGYVCKNYYVRDEKTGKCVYPNSCT